MIQFTVLAEQMYKLNPIRGRKSSSVSSVDLGYGFTKYTVSLERLGGQTTTLYIPTDSLVLTGGSPYNPPCSSEKLIVNSRKTAEGFLLNANGPGNNNIQIRLKKSSASNSDYFLEVNLREGEKYEFPLHYLPQQYLMVRGSSSDYENMLASISTNEYYLNALANLDDELAKYTNEPELVWWAKAFIGVFQDYVDVEAIGQLDSAAGMQTFSFASQTYYTTWVEWMCGDNYYEYPLEYGQFMVVTAGENCQTSASIMGGYLGCKVFKCDSHVPGSLEWGMCMHECQLGPIALEPVPHEPDCITPCQLADDACRALCDTQSCLAGCDAAYVLCVAPCNIQ